MELAIHPNELLLFYDSTSVRGKKTLAFAQTVSNHVKSMDYHQIPITGTIWKELLNMLELEPRQLLNKAHPEYQEKIANHTYTGQDWLNILIHNPHLLKAPIAVRNGKAILCNKVKDVLKLEVDHVTR